MSHALNYTWNELTGAPPNPTVKRFARNVGDQHCNFTPSTDPGMGYRSKTNANIDFYVIPDCGQYEILKFDWSTGHVRCAEWSCADVVAVADKLKDAAAIARSLSSHN